MVPSTQAPPPQETTPSTTVAGESSVPSVTSAENGVGKNIANYGAAAVAIAAVLI